VEALASCTCGVNKMFLIWFSRPEGYKLEASEHLVETYVKDGILFVAAQLSPYTAQPIRYTSFLFTSLVLPLIHENSIAAPRRPLSGGWGAVHTPAATTSARFLSSCRRWSWPPSQPKSIVFWRCSNKHS
jgi:hypothetical protein